MKKPFTQQRNDDNNMTKRRKVNPFMPVLPSPSSHVKKSTVLIKKSEAVVIKDPTRPIHLFYPIRFLSGSIDDILKWNKVTHKHPPLYETIGLYLYSNFYSSLTVDELHLLNSKLDQT